MSYLQGQQPGYGAPTQGQPAYRPPGQSGYQQGYGGQQGYGAQQGYTAPSAPQGYGAPGTAPGHPQQGYGQPGHGVPQGGGHAGYGAPQGGGHAGYGAPPGGGQAGYGAPPGGGQPGYGAPPGGGQPGYGAPPGGGQPGYGAPPGGGQPGYGAPPGGGQPGYGTPPGAARPGYGAPPSGAPPGVDPTLYNWFMAVDRDKSGAITANELREALMNNNWSHFNAETCRLMISMFDRDNSGTINLQEFSALWKYIQDWRGCFDRYDRDRSGNIDANELHTAFSEMGFRVSQGFSQMVVTRYDRASIRTVKFDDFIQICVLLRSLTDAFKQRDTNLNGVIKLSYEDFLSMAITYKP